MGTNALQARRLISALFMTFVILSCFLLVLVMIGCMVTWLNQQVSCQKNDMLGLFKSAQENNL